MKCYYEGQSQEGKVQNEGFNLPRTSTFIDNHLKFCVKCGKILSFSILAFFFSLSDPLFFLVARKIRKREMWNILY